ncbi:hypothetical protein DSECCO2_339480 [anaerobic digester metagenome]
MRAPEGADSLREGIEAVFKPLRPVRVVDGDEEHRGGCRDQDEEERDRERFRGGVEEEGVRGEDGGDGDRPEAERRKREYRKNRDGSGEERNRACVEGREEADGGEAEEEGERERNEREERQTRIEADERRRHGKPGGKRKDVEQDVVDGILHEKRAEYPPLGDGEAPGSVGDQACLPEPPIHELAAHEAERSHHHAHEQEEGVRKERDHVVGKHVCKEREGERPEKGKDRNDRREEGEPEAPEDRRVHPPLFLHHRAEEVRHRHHP